MPGRIRSIKPEILDDERSAGLSSDAWRLWVSMWLLADDYGRLRGAHEWLRSQVFWAAPERVEVSDLLEELEQAGSIRRYMVNAQSYIEIHNWAKHQRIDRPSRQKIPAPCEDSSSHPREPSSHPREPSSHPREPSSHPREPSSHPREPSSHPREPSSHPREEGQQSCTESDLGPRPGPTSEKPDYVISTPCEDSSSHPREPSSHPREPSRGNSTSSRGLEKSSRLDWDLDQDRDLKHTGAREDRVSGDAMWQAWRNAGLPPMQSAQDMEQLRGAFIAPGCEVDPVAACEAFRRLTDGWRKSGRAASAGASPSLMLRHLDKVQLVLAGELDPSPAPKPAPKRSPATEESPYPYTRTAEEYRAYMARLGEDDGGDT